MHPRTGLSSTPRRRQGWWVALLPLFILLMGRMALLQSAPVATNMILVSSSFTHQILRYDGATGGFVDVFVAAGSGGLSTPTGLTLGPDGHLYVASNGTDSVLRYDGASGKFLAAFVASGSGGLIAPEEIAFGPDGLLYVSSLLSDQVLRYHGQTGAFVDALGGTELSRPTGLAFDGGGNLYVSSMGNDAIQMYDITTGTWIAQFSAGSGGSLDQPMGLAFDSNGWLYVASSATDTVLYYSASGSLLGTFVSANSQLLNDPGDLAFGADGNLYVLGINTDNVVRYKGSTGAALGVHIAANSGGLEIPTYFIFADMSPPTPTDTPTPTLTLTPTSTVTSTPTPLPTCTPVGGDEAQITWTVNTTADNLNRTSLRCALTYARSGDLVLFDPTVFAPNAPGTIVLAAPLPPVVQGSLWIDGRGAGVILDGSALPASTAGLVVDSDRNTITGLTLRNMPGSGLRVMGHSNIIGLPPGGRRQAQGVSGPPGAPANVFQNNGGYGLVIQGSQNRVQANFIGVSRQGDQAAPNLLGGILVQAGSGQNLIGSEGQAGQGNLISGNGGPGIEIQGEGTKNNWVEGNFIGVNLDGSLALGNGAEGISIHSAADRTFVGGANPLDGNLISGNFGSGIYASGVTTLTIAGNLIGSNAGGGAAVGNRSYGIQLVNVVNAVVGGNNGGGCSGACNLIGGNVAGGILVQGANSDATRIQGNVIGADLTGYNVLGNLGSGVTVNSGGNVQVGGWQDAQRNLISGNGKHGIQLESTRAITITGNVIGADAPGLAPMANGQDGIWVQNSSPVLIGQPFQNLQLGRSCRERCNLISGNGDAGLRLTGSQTTGVLVQGNVIGATGAGDGALPNQGAGIVVQSGSQGNQIGGTNSGDFNLISGNREAGILLTGQEVKDNRIWGNVIGLNFDEARPVGNKAGIQVLDGPQNNVIGGVGTGRANIIAGNQSHGIHLRGAETTGNWIERNHIGSNRGGLGGLGNGQAGIFLEDGPSSTVIGAAGRSGNIIVDNGQDGIALRGASGNRIEGNFIGVTENGLAWGNRRDGIYLLKGASNNRIEDNLIRANSANGVRVEQDAGDPDAVGNTITDNNIYANDQEGIYLNGGNRGLAPPTVTEIVNTAANLWRIGGVTCANCVVEIFSDADTEGEFVERLSVLADATGQFTAHNVSRRGVTFMLTATDGEGNTSEFGAPLDFRVTGMEVTQAIQDLDNSVPLVQDKRTFVRLHVNSANSVYPATAHLVVVRDGNRRTLRPINGNGGIIQVQPTPDREIVDHAFLFELPRDYLAGQLSLTGIVNPAVNCDRGAACGRDAVERDYQDNEISALVSFEPVASMNIVIYRIAWRDGATVRIPGMVHVDHLTAWLRAAYPIARLNFVVREDPRPYRSRPSCSKVNKFLSRMWSQDWRNGEVAYNTRYFGMVDDAGGAPGGFMRGCAFVPGRTAASPAGVPAGGNAWDTDGSYGDWYGGHELGHAYGRKHVACRGDEKKPDGRYPHPNGRISPVLAGPTAIYGFNANTLAAYGPDWVDLMTYCREQWISDYTYHKLMTGFQNGQGGAFLDGRARLPQAESGAGFLVTGVIDLATNQADLAPIFVYTDLPTPPESPVPGDYAIVQHNATGEELARHAFTPTEPGEEESTLLGVEEIVLFAPDTTRITLEGPAGIYTTIVAGPAAPTVHLDSPNGGEVFTDPQGVLTVRWSGDDSDGDPLLYDLAYSGDDGATWQTILLGVEETQAEIPISVLSGGAASRFQVWASDGIHTASDRSDGSFSVVAPPPALAILSPQTGATYVLSQTVALAGTGYTQRAPVAEEDLLWRSDLDGVLGSGGQVSLGDLSVGRHEISLSAPSASGSISATVVITVYADAQNLPAQPDALIVGPDSLSFDPGAGMTSTLLYVSNLNFTRPLTWTAQVDQPWVAMARTTGITPEAIEVSVDPSGLSPGEYNAVITLSSPDLTSGSVAIRVQLIVEADDLDGYSLFIPILLR